MEPAAAFSLIPRPATLAGGFRISCVLRSRVAASIDATAEVTMRHRPLVPRLLASLPLFLSLSLALLLAAPPPARADDSPSRDWPQFRGAGRDGVSKETGLLRAWPPEGPKVLWRKPLGEGFSGIAVSGGRLFTMFAGAEEEFAVRLDPATGAEVWRTAVGPRFDEALGNGPRSTPTVEGDRVFTLSSTGLLAALHAGDGHKLWEVDAQKAVGAPMPLRGFACSPLVDGELLVVELGAGAGKALVAFDKATGELRWSTRDTPPGYSSPIAVTIDGVHQLVFVNTSGREVVSVLPDGTVWWTHPWPPGAIAMPLFVPPNRVLVSASADIGAMMLAVTTAEGKPKVEEVWSNRLLKNHFSSSIYRDGFVYGFDNGTLKCLDAGTGEQRWATRGFGKGSLITGDGLLFVLGDRGVLALAEATPEGYRELGRAQVFAGKTWTAPALAGGRLYLRDQGEIVCLEVAS